jgi:aspartyl-tRNA(Asn)/glutamyl-tRNA(Gln) amidotransferase subunit A
VKIHDTILQTKASIASNESSLTELVSHYLQRIEESKHLNAFVEIFADEAKSRAAEVEQKIKSGTAGKLAGLVIGIKDNICYKGHVLQASSKILDGFTSIYSSTVVERIIAEDAIIIGRLNCDEFAMGSSNEKSVYGLVRNPIDPERVPGGSSGGSASAVAAGLCHATLGTDTGGSIRQPASYTGIVGLKPTYGRVSRHGIIAYASSFDQVGPMTKNIDDAALLLEVIAGEDEYDSTVSSKPVETYSTQLSNTKKYKLAIIKECIESEGLNPEIKKAIQQQIEKFRSEGHTVEEVTFPYLDYLVPTYYMLTTAEASSNLSRYDGIHFGYRSKNAFDLESTYKKSRTEGFGTEVKRRIMLGTFVLSAGYYDAYYAKAQKARRIIKESSEKILENYDFILTPTTANVAFKIGQKSANPIEMYLEDIFTVQANLAGLPAVSIPLFQTEAKLPFGLQLMAAAYEESKLLAFSKEILNS